MLRREGGGSLLNVVLTSPSVQSFGRVRLPLDGSKDEMKAVPPPVALIPRGCLLEMPEFSMLPVEDKTFALNSISGQAKRLLCESEPVGVDLVFCHTHSQAIQIRERASPT